MAKVWKDDLAIGLLEVTGPSLKTDQGHPAKLVYPERMALPVKIRVQERMVPLLSKVFFSFN